MVDTSALLAFILDEEDADRFENAFVDATAKVISAANLLEASIVLSRDHADAERLLDRTLEDLQIRPADFTAEQLALARAAYRTFGKGRQHPAQLNFGDCFAYALAKSLDAPLLYKGDDFAHTDVKAA